MSNRLDEITDTDSIKEKKLKNALNKAETVNTKEFFELISAFKEKLNISKFIVESLNDENKTILLNQLNIFNKKYF